MFCIELRTEKFANLPLLSKATDKLKKCRKYNRLNHMAAQYERALFCTYM